MAIRQEHELHKRRFGRNLGLGLVLGGFVVLLIALTMVKIANGHGAALQGFNHKVQPGLVGKN